MTRDDVRRVLANPALLLGLGGALLFAAVALFGPQLAAADPNAQRIVIFFPGGTFAVPPTPPDHYYPLGTDPLGRDQLSRILYGARLTFTVVLLALFLRAALAISFGVLGGWAGGAVDRALTTVTNAVGGVPQFLLALLIAVALRERAIVGFIVALGLVGWAEGAQFVRSEVVRIRTTGYVEAARALGTRRRGILSRHVLRGLAPQLFGLLSLEAGSTLLLLAELGFLGVFMSGGAFLVDNDNRPVLPARDRAPEWGQMLAGAQQYAFSNQYVAFVPGVVVCAAVFVFNLLGEGVRSATDPFSRLSLSPRGLGLLGRGLLAVAVVSGAFFGISEARATSLSFDDALRLARESAAGVEPGAPLVAAVVRLRSDAHGLERAEKYNFYFRSSGITPYWRVGFPDADQNAMETKRDEEDGVQLDALQPLVTDGIVDWRAALAAAEKEGGQQYRASTRTWLVRLVLGRSEANDDVYYRGMYTSGSMVGAPSIDAFVDARSGISATLRLQDVALRARAEQLLGGSVAMVSANMVWRSPGSNGGFGVGRPLFVSYQFIRADRSNDVRVAGVGPTFAGGGSIIPSGPRVPLSTKVDLLAAFERVEASGGRAVRDRWGNVTWDVTAVAVEANGRTQVTFTYAAFPSLLAAFRFDPSTGTVERIT